MSGISSLARIVMGLACLTISGLLVAGLLGLIPDPADSIRKSRAAFCETAAISFTTLAPHMDISQIQAALKEISSRQTDLNSLAIRRTSGEMIVEIGQHADSWQTTPDRALESFEFLVPIATSGQKWGQLEARFQDEHYSVLGIPVRTDIALAIFMGLALTTCFYFYLKKILNHLNPFRIVPPRVREALDALAEGLLILDRQHRVVLANSAFSTGIAVDSAVLLGRNAGQIGFRRTEEGMSEAFPWEKTNADGAPIRGSLLKFGTGTSERTFSVSTVPIHDDRGKCRGVVASFEDVTELDRKQKELREALSSLKSSSDEIRQQNRELEWLATRDALTGCMNRRSFFDVFEDIWSEALRSHDNICAVMLDIDHFKSINDRYGHATGDEVLRKVATTIMSMVTECDVVCRYGGEEFSILMPRTDLDEATMRADRIRVEIMRMSTGHEGLSITASFGVSCTTLKSISPQDLLDQADKCLYVAKRYGRNRVVRFDKSQDQAERVGEAGHLNKDRIPVRSENVTIPYQAVSALVSALSFRDHRTAAHCRRVADLCVATAEGLLSMRECYTLEIAALLHDIGKIGIPDAILHKVDKLTEAEWDIMRRHSAVGIQLIRASFASSALTEIMEQQHIWFDLSNLNHTFPPGTRPGLSSRILAIVDAYDSMTSDTAYRRGLSHTEAIEELRLCAGTQFDPELVERFVLAIRLQSGTTAVLPQVSTDTALNIGLQIERLVAALDDQDFDTLRELVSRLQTTALQCEIPHMASVASLLHQSLHEDADLIEAMQIATELLDLCRLTQVSLIQGIPRPDEKKYAVRTPAAGQKKGGDPVCRIAPPI